MREIEEHLRWGDVLDAGQDARSCRRQDEGDLGIEHLFSPGVPERLWCDEKLPAEPLRRTSNPTDIRQTVPIRAMSHTSATLWMCLGYHTGRHQDREGVLESESDLCSSCNTSTSARHEMALSLTAVKRPVCRTGLISRGSLADQNELNEHQKVDRFHSELL
jgi:hypothetical protein